MLSLAVLRPVSVQKALEDTSEDLRKSPEHMNALLEVGLGVDVQQVRAQVCLQIFGRGCLVVEVVDVLGEQLGKLVRLMVNDVLTAWYDSHEDASSSFSISAKFSNLLLKSSDMADRPTRNLKETAQRSSTAWQTSCDTSAFFPKKYLLLSPAQIEQSELDRTVLMRDQQSVSEDLKFEVGDVIEVGSLSSTRATC